MRNHIEKRFSLDYFTCLKGLLSEMSPTFILMLMFTRHSPVQSAVKKKNIFRNRIYKGYAAFRVRLHETTFGLIIINSVCIRLFPIRNSNQIMLKGISNAHFKGII